MTTNQRKVTACHEYFFALSLLETVMGGSNVIACGKLFCLPQISTQAEKQMDNALKFIKQNKKLTIILAVAVLVVLVSISANSIQKNNRAYYINVSDTVNLECKAHPWQDSVKCEPTEVVGTFSNYDDLEFRAEDGGTVTNIEGDNFTVWENGYISYKYKEFSAEQLQDGYRSYTTLRLRGGKHNEALATKVIEFKYNFTEDDIKLLSQSHNEWKIAEEKRIAQEEADKIAQEKANKLAEENRLATEATNKQEEEAQTVQSEYKMPDDISIYDIKELCERHAESKGYPNAEIKVSTLSGEDMEDGNHYRVNGTLYKDEGITSSEKAVGDYACTANYNTWTVTGAFLNRQEI